MKKQKYNSQQMAVIKALGINTKGGSFECTGRKGTVYLTLPDGQKRPFSVERDTGQWTVCDCEHEAFALVMDYMSNLLERVLKAAMHGELMWVPAPSDFSYIFTEDVVEDDNIEVGDEAATVIANIMEKL